ncbi:beta strand repeat-containing protein, partial [Roseateles albus]|nr:calcium-binding protein [Roseateles albus]
DDIVNANITLTTSVGQTTTTLLGGAGNDRLTVTDNGAGYANPAMPGMTSSSGIAYASLDGGDGNDTLSAGGVLQLSMTGGAGADTFVLTAQQYRTVLEGTRMYGPMDPMNPNSGTPIKADATVITDFAVGVGGDVLDYSDLLRSATIGFDGSNPFTGGYLKLMQSGADTLLSFDADGAAGTAKEAVTIAVLKGINGGDLVAANFNPNFPIGGNLPVGQVLTGTALADKLTGTAADDIIKGLGGNDVIEGLGGNDHLDGGDGDDSLKGQDGNDNVYGGEGSDSLDGGAGVDNLSGGAGDDRLVYDAIDGNVSGGAGLDLLVLQSDAVIGNINLGNAADQTAGDNALVTQMEGVDFSAITQAVSFSGNSGGADWLIGSAFNDSLSGLAGDDVLDGGVGADSLIGGQGNDIFLVDDAGDTAIESANEGTDEVRSTVNYTFAANVEKLSLLGSANLNGTGNELNNSLIGNAGNNQLSGGGGNDLLDGGAGADKLLGGSGDDVYLVDNAGDSVTEFAGEGGNDEVRSSVDFTLSAEVEKLTLTGSVGLHGTGNSSANVIVGTAGNDVINGGAGGDTLQGGSGDDSYHVDSLSDVVIEQVGGGIDTVYTSVGYSLGNNIENVIVTGTASAVLTGNGGDNQLLGGTGADALNGGAGNDLLDGGAGNDTLSGGSGDDVYVVDAVGDKVIELGGQGIDTVKSSISYTLGAELENLTLLEASGAAPKGLAANAAAFKTASSNLPGANGAGNNLSNIIIGNSGNNTLSGDAGVDTLTGGGGSDHFADTASNLNQDRITDLGFDDAIDVWGSRFSATRYNASTGVLELDTAGNGSYSTKVNLTPGLVGEFVATPSAAGQAASTQVRLMLDSDGDGVGDFHDNAIFVANADQRDTDGDGYGNVVDADLNQDFMVDFFDLSMLDSVFYTDDPDADLNGDGLVDFFDLSMLDDLFGKAPGPSYVDLMPAGAGSAASDQSQVAGTQQSVEQHIAGDFLELTLVGVHSLHGGQGGLEWQHGV